MQKQIVYSYSNLSTYTNCAYQFYRRYVKKDVPFPDTPQIRAGNAAHTAFKERFQQNKPFPEGMQHFEPIAAAIEPPFLIETKLGMTKDGKPSDYWNGSYIRGQIDCAKYNETKAYMFDWKTGNLREKPLELAIGAMLLKANYPNLKTIFGRYVWLKLNKLGYEYDLSDDKATMQECNLTTERIDRSFATFTWDKNPTPLCGYCEVLDCEYNKNERKKYNR